MPSSDKSETFKRETEIADTYLLSIKNLKRYAFYVIQNNK